MRITSSKRDDILKEREEYQAQWDENERTRGEEQRSFQEAEDAVLNPIKEYLEQELAYYRALNFDVRVNRGWARDFNSIEVSIRCNEYRKFDENAALSWNFDAKLKFPDKESLRSGDISNVEVVKETGSCSGLQATNATQLRSLRQSLDALEFLNDLDWVTLLNKEMPKYDDYLKTPRMQSRDNEFKKRLLEADLEDLVGSNKLVKVDNFESSGYRSSYVYLRLISETPAQYKCNVVSEWELKRYQSGEATLDERYTQRVKKSNVRPILDNDGNIITVEV